MIRTRLLLSIVVGALATLCVAGWSCGSAHGQCCGWLTNTYYESTFGQYGSCTCQPTYFVPRLRPHTTLTPCCGCGTCGYCGYRYGGAWACGEGCPWGCRMGEGPSHGLPYPPELASGFEPVQFERLGEVPNDMLGDAVVGAR